MAWTGLRPSRRSGGDSPCPGRSTVMTSLWGVSRSSTAFHPWRRWPSPWSSTSVGPDPRRSNARFTAYLLLAIYSDVTSAAVGAEEARCGGDAFGLVWCNAGASLTHLCSPGIAPNGRSAFGMFAVPGRALAGSRCAVRLTRVGYTVISSRRYRRTRPQRTLRSSSLTRPVTGGQPDAHSRCVIPSAPAQWGALPPILAWGRAYLQDELSTTPKPPESSHGPSSSRTIATTWC
jgi:hypothetical protein